MLEALNSFLAHRMGEFEEISAERKRQLAEVADYIRDRRASSEPIWLTFICTHNSRRSHMAQIWAAVAAAYYGIGQIETFSGGTEATEFNQSAVEALRQSGMRIESPEADNDNPKYQITFSETLPALNCFSKVFDQAPNATENFAAIMVCTSADEACPIVDGADGRFAIPYVDPKISDGTEEEAATYNERSRQIAREMLFLMSNANEE